MFSNDIGLLRMVRAAHPRPKWVGSLARRCGRAPAPWSAPGPESAKALPVPANYRLRFYDMERFAPPCPPLREPHQKARSSSPNSGRFDLRRSRASCCRSARFSSVRSVRVLSAARRAPNRASTRDIALPGSHDGRPSSSRDRVLARDKSESSSRAMRSNCLANADEFVEATEQVNDRQAHAEKARYLAHAEQRTRRPG